MATGNFASDYSVDSSAGLSCDDFNLWNYDGSLPHVVPRNSFGMDPSNNIPNATFGDLQNVGMQASALPQISSSFEPGPSFFTRMQEPDIQPHGPAMLDAVQMIEADPDVEFASLFDDNTPNATTDEILRVVCDKILPYRAKDFPRLFPPVYFYELLLQNEEDRDEVIPLATRCVKWFLNMTPEQADSRIAEIHEVRRAMKAKGLDQEPQAHPAKNTKRSRSAKKAAITSHQHPVLVAELAKSPRMEYRPSIRSMEEYLTLSEAYVTYIRQMELNDVAETDETWPSTTAMEIQYVKQAALAIFDTTDFAEKTDALNNKAHIDKLTAERQGEADGEADSVGNIKKRKRGADATDAVKKLPKLNPSESILADPNSSPARLLKAVLRYEITDFEVELLS
ncbi:hypothetical protein CkaCkLH20_02075 [Colletotrichum karsti]|uniref:Uncharacterized protein n=1 Tax=Colletotrichum karsti TaxID=1095194 RepID=A0A9P6IDZ5_9PEZI|nr:uncharacterized protein CkaCkLH20_02075 [Colletotrichum karsti]KAF9880121.1 hypothetical protein CkaCkLH20_02075 [Colletotrichum karsti]